MSKLWGGRFSKKTHALVEKFSRSIQFDHKIGKFDTMGSMIHIQVLKKAGYLTASETAKLSKALSEIYKAFEEGSFRYDPESEDIHSNIQNALEKKVGNLVLKLQTARSRNDQVTFATKLYCKEEADTLLGSIDELIEVIRMTAEKNKDIIIPGFTHLQHAQPILLSDYLDCYVEMLKRDFVRVKNIDVNLRITLGAGSVAGTPIAASDYEAVISKIFKNRAYYPIKVEATHNSVDVVSDRDFVIEFLSALALIGGHLSRIAEDLIIYSTKEFDFIELDDAYCTGSSLMPQKKNPDILELIRGYAGRLNGNLVGVLTMMKGLPLSYNRDMQLDKEPLFESFTVIQDELSLLKGIMKTIRFNTEKIKKHLLDESLYATDLVYYLVNKNVPFKKAHTAIGELIQHSIGSGVHIKEMSEAALKKFSDKLVKKDILKLFDPKKSVAGKRSIKRN